MSKVLLIRTSMMEDKPQGSISTEALKRWKEFYQQFHPEDDITEMNLNTDPVGKEVLTSKNFDEFFSKSDKYIDQLKNMDKLVISTPMTNFNYPAPLKNYLDHILVANKTFKYKYDGDGASEGLLKHLKVLLINTQGAPKGWYPFGDHTISLTGTWKFTGAHFVEPIIIAGTKTKDFQGLSKEEIVEKYIEDIKKSAKAF